MTLSDLERGHIFLADLRNLRSYRLTENDHIWYGNTCGKGSISRVSHAPSQGAASDDPQFLGLPTCAHMLRETATEFNLVIKLDKRKIFFLQFQPRPVAWPQIM